jgi:hypothetical protein
MFRDDRLHQMTRLGRVDGIDTFDLATHRGNIE